MDPSSARTLSHRAVLDFPDVAFHASGHPPGLAGKAARRTGPHLSTAQVVGHPGHRFWRQPLADQAVGRIDQNAYRRARPLAENQIHRIARSVARVCRRPRRTGAVHRPGDAGHHLVAPFPLPHLASSAPDHAGAVPDAGLSRDDAGTARLLVATGWRAVGRCACGRRGCQRYRAGRIDRASPPGQWLRSLGQERRRCDRTHLPPR